MYSLLQNFQLRQLQEHFGQGRSRVNYVAQTNWKFASSVMKTWINAWRRSKKNNDAIYIHIVQKTVQLDAKKEVNVNTGILSMHWHITNILSCTGCGQLFVTDGIWKLNFPVCMYQVQVSPLQLLTMQLQAHCVIFLLQFKVHC